MDTIFVFFTKVLKVFPKFNKLETNIGIRNFEKAKLHYRQKLQAFLNFEYGLRALIYRANIIGTTKNEKLLLLKSSKDQLSNMNLYLKLIIYDFPAEVGQNFHR